MLSTKHSQLLRPHNNLMRQRPLFTGNPGSERCRDLPRVPQLESGGAATPADSGKHSKLQCPSAFGMSLPENGGPGAGARQAAGEPGRAGDTHLSSFPPGLLESRRLAGTT